MSSRRRTGFSEGKGAIPVDLFLKRRSLRTGSSTTSTLQPSSRDRCCSRSSEPAEIVKTATRKAFSQADRDIDVGGIGLSTGRGAKQGNTHHANGAELLFMLPQGTYHLVAVHGFILPYLLLPQ